MTTLNKAQTDEQANNRDDRSFPTIAFAWRRYARDPKQLLFGATIVFLWLQLINYATVPVFSEGYLDVSWQYCNAFFLEHSLRAGIDYVFPSGLLGFFYGNVYDSRLFWFQWAWELIFAGFATAKIAQVCRRYPSLSARIGILLTTAIVLSYVTDVIYYIVLLIIATNLMDREPRKPLSLVPDALALIALSLLKFKFLVMAAQILLIVLVAGGAERRRSSLILLTAHVVGYLLFWLLLKQRLSDLPVYLKNMVILSGGYMQAMGWTVGDILPFTGVLLMAAFLYILAQANKDKTTRSLPLAILFVVILLQIFKHGFVRNDHAGVFFGSMMFALFLVPVASGTYRPLSRKSRALLAFSLVACWLGNNVALEWNSRVNGGFWRHTVASAMYVFAPTLTQRQLNARYAEQAQIWNLPRINAIVGNSTVDVMGYSQFIAFLHDWNYDPRPVYQSYCAFTPALLKLNGDFYRGARAPRYVLMRLESIDERIPTLDDSDVLSVLWQQYHPVAVEKGFLLLSRNAPSAVNHAVAPSFPAKTSFVSHRVVHFWEAVPLPDDAQWHLISLRVKPSLSGQLLGAALRPKPVLARIEMNDGASVRYRLIPAMGQKFFLIDPVLKTTRDVVALYGGVANRRVRSFAVEQEARKGVWSVDRIEIDILSCPSQIRQPLSPAETRALLLPDGWQAPDASALK